VLATKDAQQAGELAGVRPARQAQHRGCQRVRLQHKIAVACRLAASRQGGHQRQALLHHAEARPAFLNGQMDPLPQHAFEAYLPDEAQERGQARPTAAAGRLPLHAGIGIEPILHRLHGHRSIRHSEPPETGELDTSSLPGRLAVRSAHPEMRISDV